MIEEEDETLDSWLPFLADHDVAGAYFVRRACRLEIGAIRCVVPAVYYNKIVLHSGEGLDGPGLACKNLNVDLRNV